MMNTILIWLPDSSAVRFEASTLELALYHTEGAAVTVVTVDATLLNSIGRVAFLNTVLHGCESDADVVTTWEDYTDTLLAYLLPCYAKDADDAMSYTGAKLTVAREHGLFVSHEIAEQLGADQLDALRDAIGTRATNEYGVHFATTASAIHDD